MSKSSEKRQRTALLAIRMTPAERQRITDATSALGVSAGRFIRDAALSRAAVLPQMCEDCGCWTGWGDCPYCTGAPHPRGRDETGLTNQGQPTRPDNSPAAHTAPAIGIPASAPDDDDWDYALRNMVG